MKRDTPPRTETARQPADGLSTPRHRHDLLSAAKGRPEGDHLGHSSVAIIAERDQTIEPLIRTLQKQRLEVRHVWPPPAQLPMDAQVVFSVLLPDLPMRLSGLPGAPETALVVLLPAAGRLDLRVLRNCTPHAVLHLPANETAIEVALAMAHDLFGYEKRLIARINKLDENLRTIRTVERAKTILIAARGMSEDDAYQFLRKQAMAKRVSIGRLSAALVDSEDLLG
jgi:AmiR/NasT family two-component response regulator